MIVNKKGYYSLDVAKMDDLKFKFNSLLEQKINVLFIYDTFPGPI